jgi:HSP20 family protein
MNMLPTLRRPDGGRALLRDWDRLENRLQRLMGPSSLWEPTSEAFLWAPRVDFAEKNGGFALTAEIPGVNPDDVNIEVEGNVLTITGEKKVEREHKDERVQLSERRYGAFERSFTLPSSADPEQVSAEFKQGVLSVQIGKRPEARGKKIQITAG